MLLDRLYKPASDELIYHYCRPAAFLEIIRSRTMWLSAYYALNDSMERDWGYSIFDKAANALHKELGATFIDNIAALVAAVYSQAMLMVASYSLDADVLSQWRAYADDGQGFAIGLSPKQLEVPAKPLRVLYEEELQIGELLGNIRHSYEYEKSIGFQYNDQFQRHFFQIGLDLCAFKNAAFREEREIRYVHVSGLAPEGAPSKFVALGARDQDGKRLSEPRNVQFRVSDGVIIPYIIVDYTNEGKVSPIKEVVLGPRNQNTESAIEMFLNTVGVVGVTVRRSKAPYR